MKVPLTQLYIDSINVTYWGKKNFPLLSFFKYG